MSVHDRIRELGVTIPDAPAPVANYVGAVTVGNLVFVSGHGPRRADGSLVRGRLGEDLTVDEGYEAARLTMLQCLASLQREVGDLCRVRRIVRLFGMVRCTPTFGQQPQVINGASDLLVAIWGEEGRHARAAVGMQDLPAGMAVEIEMVVEIA